MSQSRTFLRLVGASSKIVVNNTKFEKAENIGVRK